MADHMPGSMDISVQQKTFAGFVRMAGWVAGLALVLLVFIALVNG